MLSFELHHFIFDGNNKNEKSYIWESNNRIYKPFSWCQIITCGIVCYNDIYCRFVFSYIYRISFPVSLVVNFVFLSITQTAVLSILSNALLLSFCNQRNLTNLVKQNS